MKYTDKKVSYETEVYTINVLPDLKARSQKNIHRTSSEAMHLVTTHPIVKREFISNKKVNDRNKYYTSSFHYKLQVSETT